MTTALEAVSRSAAWVAIFLLTMVIIITVDAFRTTFYITEFMVDYQLFSWYTRFTKRLPPQTILTSYPAKNMTFVWLPLLVIALLSIWLRHWPFQTPKTELAYDPTRLHPQKVSRFDRWTRQIKLFFLYQLPPRRFWTWFLEGGFNLIDLLVVIFWVSSNALYLYVGYDRQLPSTKAASLKAFKANKTPINHSADFCDALGYGTAWAAVYNFIFVFIPLPRSNFLQYLFNTDFSGVIKYHRWLGHGALFMSLFHGIVYYAAWIAVSGQKFVEETFAWQARGINYLAGSIAFFPFGLLMWLGTIPYIRRNYFKIFLSSHIFGFLGFMLLVQIHYPQSIFHYPALVFYFMDVAFRMAQWRVTSGVQCTFVSADSTFATLRLKFNKAAKVKASQFLYLNIPSVSWWEWHPLSIAGVVSGADNLSQEVTLHLKAYGSWSKDVVQQLADMGTISVRVDGPYGYASKPEWTHFDTIIMVAGGIGITPMLAMLREIQCQQQQIQAKTQELPEDQQRFLLPAQVHLIWAVRNRDELQLLDQSLLETAGLPGSWLKLRLYQTGPHDDFVDTASQEASSDSDSLQSSKIPCIKDGNISIVSQLQPYGFGDFHWALAHVLAMIGAAMGLILISAYVYEGKIIGLTLSYRVEGIGLLFFLALVVGSMGLPALIIYPLHFFRYRRHVEACKRAYRHAAQMHASSKQAQTESLRMDTQQALQIMPNNQAKPGPLDLETGKAAMVSLGRPDLTTLIAEAVAEHPQESHFGVIASGPPSLVGAARSATHKASLIARKLGLRGIPELAFSSHSFQF